MASAGGLCNSAYGAWDWQPGLVPSCTNPGANRYQSCRTTTVEFNIYINLKHSHSSTWLDSFYRYFHLPRVRHLSNINLFLHFNLFHHHQTIIRFVAGNEH